MSFRAGPGLIDHDEDNRDQERDVAGRGERLKPLTETIPKCLVPINGQPLLGIWLEHLEESGIKDVLVNTHWLHETVE